MSSVSRRLAPEPFGSPLSLLGAHPTHMANDFVIDNPGWLRALVAD